MKLKFVLIAFLFLFSLTNAYQMRDIVHGFSVNVPDNYTVKASSKTGKIIIRHINGKKGVSIFVLKNSKSKDPTYLLKVLTLPIYKTGTVFYKTDNNKVISRIDASYLSFSVFFDSDYVQDLVSRGLAFNPAHGIISIIKGKKYSLATVLVYSDEEDVKELNKIIFSFKLEKPKIKYKTIPIHSILFKIPAVYVDLPQDCKVMNSFYISNIMEVPAILIQCKDGKVFLGLTSYNYLYSNDPLMPYAMAYYTDLKTGQQIPLSNLFSSHEEFINFILNQIFSSYPNDLKLVYQEPYPLEPNSTSFYYRILSKNTFGSALIVVNEMFMGNSKAGNWSGLFSVVGGKNLEKLIGILNSFEINPKWMSKNLKVASQELKKEIEHQKWMWREIRKTQDYINKLHRKAIKEEEIFQQEMARAVTNILSDYTYVRDPETGEIFHIENEFEQYWRDEEGEIYGISGEIDERALEVEGFKKLQIRVEGFGQWDD